MEKILDVQDAYVTSGFIDIHRHGDWQALHHGDDELLNRQGLITVANGNCGLSVAPAGKKYTEEIYSFLGSVTGKMNGDPLPVMESMGSYLDALLIENLESIQGALLRMNRSIQAEGTFGIIKNDRWYKRIVRRGIKSVLLEVFLVSIGHNLYKYHNKQKKVATVA